MKVLYVARLFTGLETSVIEQRWQPTGAPTSYKLIEALDAGPHEVDIVLTCKDNGSAWVERRDRRLTISGLRAPVTVLAGGNVFPNWLGPVRGVLRELRHGFWTWRRFRQSRPDIVYMGHANIWQAGIFARFQRVPVVLRVMGIYPVMRAALTGRGVAARLLRWCYRAPYAAAVVTQDGSGVEPWLDRAIDPGVTRHVMLNGVDLERLPASPDPRLAALPADKTVVLFLGHLHEQKGCDEFMTAFLAARRAAPDALHAVLVGRGPRRADLDVRVAEADADADVTFIERLSHEQVIEAHARAGIYVSLNKLGNLSNANLEAMRIGQCMIFPAAQPDLGVDVAADALLPDGAAVRIPSSDDTEALAAAILELHRAPELRTRIAETMRKAAAEFIPSWESRLSAEIAALEIAAGVDL